jgi:hypothetical protein
MPQESTIDLGDLTDKNVGQLKILNAAIFPVQYNNKFYSDLLLPGREELTKLGMIYCAPKAICPLNVVISILQ